MSRTSGRLPPAKALLDRVAICVVVMILLLAVVLSFWMDRRAEGREEALFEETVDLIGNEIEDVLSSTEQRLFDIRAYLGSAWPVTQAKLERYVELSYDPSVDRTELMFVATLFSETELAEYKDQQTLMRPDFDIRLGATPPDSEEFLVVTASAIQRSGNGEALHDLDVGVEVSNLWTDLNPNESLVVNESSQDELTLLPVGSLFLVTSAELFRPNFLADVLGAETLGLATIRSLDNDIVGVAALVLDLSKTVKEQLTDLPPSLKVAVTLQSSSGANSQFSFGSEESGTYENAPHAQSIEVVTGGSSWTAQIWSTRSLGDGQGTVRLLLWLGALVSAAIAYTGIILRRSNDMRIIDAEVRYAESKRMLRLDGLTGLQNRAGMHESIASALENKTTNPRRDFATVFLDLNDFKPVNDTYGHEVGDEVLRRTGSALRSALRAQDSIARIGGDEFVALCLNVSSSETADRLARDVHAAMSGIEIEVGGESIRIEASVGINITPQLDRPSVAEVLRRADAAMYDAKRSPGSQRTRITLGSQKARRNNANESVPERRVISSMVTKRTPLRALDGRDIGEMIQPFLDEPAGARQVERVFRANASSALRQHTARWLAEELAASRPTRDQWAQWVRLPRGGLDEILLRELSTAWAPSEHFVLSFVVCETDLDKRISRHPKMVRMLGDMGISLVVEDYGLGTIPIPKFEAFPRVRTLLVSPEIVSEERPPSSLLHAVTDFARKYGLHVAVNVSVDHSNGGTDGAYISMVVGTDSRHPAVLQD